MSPRVSLPALALGTAVLAAGCGGAAKSAAHAPRTATRTVAQAPESSVARFLNVEPARRSVELTLIAADGPRNNGFNFDGYGRGELQVDVPRGWRVTVRFRNAGSLFNSCAVVSGIGATTLAFPGASTPNPVEGLAAGASATFSFSATRTGSYRLASLVPGHEEARMWDVLEVTSGGRPVISTRPGP